MENDLVGIDNIFLNDGEFKCFGCSTKNTFGLQLKFSYNAKQDQVHSNVVLTQEHSR